MRTINVLFTDDIKSQRVVELSVSLQLAPGWASQWRPSLSDNTTVETTFRRVCSQPLEPALPRICTHRKTKFKNVSGSRRQLLPLYDSKSGNHDFERCEKKVFTCREKIGRSKPKAGNGNPNFRNLSSTSAWAI